MSDSNQLPLKLVSLPDPKKTFKSDVLFTAKGITNLNEISRQVLTLILAQMNDVDHPYFQISVNELETYGKKIDMDTFYLEARTVVSELMSCQFFLENPKDKSIYGVHMLDTSKLSQPCGYKKGVFTFRMNELVVNFLKQWSLGQYQENHTPLLFKAKSYYTWQFIWALSRYKDTGYWLVSADDYARYMDCAKTYDRKGREKKKYGKSIPKYPSKRMLYDRTIAKPLEELKGTDLEFEGEIIYGTPGEDGGRKPITHFMFKLKNKAPKTIPQDWLVHEHRGKAVRTMLKWGLTEKEVVKYVSYFEKDIYLIIDYLKEQIYLDSINKREEPIRKLKSFIRWHLEHWMEWVKNNPFDPIPLKVSDEFLQSEYNKPDGEEKSQQQSYLDKITEESKNIAQSLAQKEKENHEDSEPPF
ncbi:MAG: replication initiation protein [Cytophagales bacterium]|nr:replication initiation protein [Cytophagales bacterium]